MASEEIRVGKTFVCECGTTFDFDLRTHAVLSSLNAAVACPKCGAQKQVTLENFLKTCAMSIQATETSSSVEAQLENPLSFMDEPATSEKIEEAESYPNIDDSIYRDIAHR